MCALYVGPAIGARGQLGFAEEGGWGSQQQTPDNFVEINSEGVVSEIGTLVSGALRADRATHKRTTGVESAGGPTEVEVSPRGFETWFKHALGDVTTTRLDTAFVLESTNPAETQCDLVITHTAGVATELSVTLAVGATLTLDLTDPSYDTIGEVMTAINAHANLAAYSPYQLTQGTLQTTIHASDYLLASDDSNCLEELATIDLLSVPNRRWVVSAEWGVYSHQIQGGARLPSGLSIEMGRDIAAFIYAGSKIDTMELTAETGDFFMGNFAFMAKGATTAGTPVATSTNTGNEKNAFRVRYIGEQSTATLAIDNTAQTIALAIDGTSEDILHNLSEPFVDPSTGTVYNLQKLGGLVDYLDDLSYIDCQINDHASPNTNTTDLKTITATDITPTTYVIFNYTQASIPSIPVTWGDYIGSDEGDSVRFYVKVTTGGVPGTAVLQFKKTAAGSYANTTVTSATLPSEVRTGANVDSGFTVFFPDDTALILDDEWYFETIKGSTTASYPTINAFSGFEGVLTLDGATSDIMGWNATLNNNLYGDKYHLGYRTRAKLPEQDRTIEGSVNVEFDNLDLYRKFINGVAMNLEMTFTSSDYIATTALGNSASQYSMVVRQPAIEFNGTTPTNADKSIILTDFPYTALWDDTNNIPELRITIVSNVPYV